MIRAFAESRAQEIRKQGDREAATYLGQMNSNPELAVFLRRMEFLQRHRQAHDLRLPHQHAGL